MNEQDGAIFGKTGETKITLQALKQDFPLEFHHPFKQLIQILVARAAGIGKLVFHAVSGQKLTNASKYAEDAIGDDLDTLDKLSDFILDRHYQWGVSDGN